MKKPRSLRVRGYAARLIDLNEYLDFLPGDTLSDKIGVTKLNENLLNIIPNRCYEQAYVQGFDCGYISFKKDVIMLDRMEIAEYIYKSVVEPYYKKPTREDINRAGRSRKNIGEADLYKTHPATVESADKRIKRYVDRSTIELETFLIHIPGHSSD